MSAATIAPRRSSDPPKLRADQARALVDAQGRYDKAKRALDERRAERDELLEKLRPRLPVGRWVEVAGWAIRVTMQPTGQRFRLSEFLQRHKLTPAMAPFVTTGEDRPRLWIKPAGTKPAR